MWSPAGFVNPFTDLGGSGGAGATGFDALPVAGERAVQFTAAAAQAGVGAAGPNHGVSPVSPFDGSGVGAAAAAPEPPVTAAIEIPAENVEAHHEQATQDGAAIHAAEAKSAEAIRPGCDEWRLNLKGQYPTGHVKPKGPALKAEVVRRDPNRRPNAWKLPDIVTWLHKHEPPRGIGSGGIGGGFPGDGGGGGVPGGTPGQGQEEEEEAAAGGSERWSWLRHGPRMAEVIKETGVDFSRRDQRMNSRKDLDSAARNWYWQTACNKFNEPQFKPATLKPQSDWAHEKFLSERIDPSTTCGYVLEPGRMEEKFKEMRTKLKKCLAKFRRSGNGDGAVVDDTGKDLFSSRFETYCDNNVVMYYWYELLVTSGLLESACGSMPAGSGDSSDPTKGPRPVAGHKKRRTKAEEMSNSMASALRQPVRIHKTAKERQAEVIAVRVAKIKEVQMRTELEGQLERSLDELEDLIKEREASSKDVKRHYAKKARLEHDLEQLVRQGQEGDEDEFVSSDDEDDDEEDEEGSSCPSSRPRSTRTHRGTGGPGGDEEEILQGDEVEGEGSEYDDYGEEDGEGGRG